jgi:hypothetical protein
MVARSAFRVPRFELGGGVRHPGVRNRGTRNSELGTSLLACLTLACGGAGGQAGTGANDTLYIAVAAMPSTTGQPYIDGAVQAIADLNRRRPPGRRPLGIRLPPADEPSQVAVATAFRDDPRVVGVIGHTGSAQTLDAAPIYGDVEHQGRRALVAITPTATNPAVTAANPWIYRICPTDDDVAGAGPLCPGLAAPARGGDLPQRSLRPRIPAGLRRGVYPGGGVVVERDPISPLSPNSRPTRSGSPGGAPTYW